MGKEDAQLTKTWVNIHGRIRMVLQVQRVMIAQTRTKSKRTAAILNSSTVRKIPGIKNLQ